MIKLKKIRLFNRNNRRLSIVTLITLLGILSSCVSQREVEYLQDKDKNIKSFAEAGVQDYKIKPNDELYIQINSLDEAAANVFSPVGNQQASNMGNFGPYAASLVSYTVSQKGFVALPIIGNIFVKDKTTSEVSTILKDSLANILSQPIISVKLVNRYVSVLGEVRNPGHFAYAQEKLNVYDALGLAGDITDYGDRNEVILTRNEHGKNIRILIDLGTSQILASDYYFLRPNDILYVKPLRKKFWGLRQFPFTLVLSSITTALLIYNVVKLK